jgi:hypothetical protein
MRPKWQATGANCARPNVPPVWPHDRSAADRWPGCALRLRDEKLPFLRAPRFPRPLGSRHINPWGGSVAAIRPISFCDPSPHRRVAFSDRKLSARSHGEVLPDSERAVPGGRREGQAQAPRPHRREELRPPHAPSRVSPLSSLYSTQPCPCAYFRIAGGSFWWPDLGFRIDCAGGTRRGRSTCPRGPAAPSVR